MTRLAACIVLTAVLLLCGCATVLTGTDHGFERVTPEKPMLSWTGTLGTGDSLAYVSTRLGTKYLSERVEDRRLRTDYTWLNRGCWFGATAALVGIAVKLDDWGQHYRGTDTVMGSSTTLAILSGIPFLAGLVYPRIPIPPRHWEKKVTFPEDTSYQFLTPVAQRSATVAVPGTTNEKTLKTSADGSLLLDIRDFCAAVPTDSVLRLSATCSGLAATLIVPARQVASVKQRETDASALLERARAAESNNKDETALVLYDSLGNSYRYEGELGRHRQGRSTEGEGPAGARGPGSA